jgi:hypothetical protein
MKRMFSTRCLAILSCLGLLGSAYGQVTVNVEKELMITDLFVVEHSVEALKPSGAFHVQTLFSNMAPSGKTAKDVMLSLFTSFRDDALDRQPRKIDEVVLDKWKRWKLDGTRRSPSDPLPSDEDWDVNWEKAPFRLLAIVNRIDLRLNPAIGNAGEGRFVFGITDAETGAPLGFTLILEYVQPTGGDETKLKDIAESWHDLGTSPAFDQDYVNKLKAVVSMFTAKDANPGFVNGSALSQVRSNEIETSFGAAANTGWELREWRLSPATGLLTPVSVKETPHKSLDNSETLAFLLDQFGKSLTSNLPEGLLGKRAITGFNPGFEWRASGVPPKDSRLRRFSVHTCNGCHGGDAATGDGTAFYQIQPREVGQVSRLSRFLTGKHPDGLAASPVVIPVTGEFDNPSAAAFSDLLRRKRDFEGLLTSLPGGIDGPSLLLQSHQIQFDRVH